MAEQGSPCLTESEAKTVLARAEKVLEVFLISLRRYDVVKWEKLVYAIYLGPEDHVGLHVCLLSCQVL